MKYKIVLISIVIIIFIAAIILNNSSKIMLYDGNKTAFNYDKLLYSKYDYLDGYLDQWSLTRSTTIADLEILTQNYLDQYYEGIKVNSQEFYGLVKEMFFGESYQLWSKAKNDSNFGPVYLYICIYHIENMADETLLKDQ